MRPLRILAIAAIALFAYCVAMGFYTWTQMPADITVSWRKEVLHQGGYWPQFFHSFLMRTLGLCLYAALGAVLYVCYAVIRRLATPAAARPRTP